MSYNGKYIDLARRDVHPGSAQEEDPTKTLTKDQMFAKETLLEDYYSMKFADFERVTDAFLLPEAFWTIKCDTNNPIVGISEVDSTQWQYWQH